MQSARGKSYQPVWVGVGREWWPALKFNVPEEITGFPQEKAILFGNREVPKNVTSLPSVQWKEGLERGYAAQENVPPAFDLAMKQVEMFTMMAHIPGDWPTTYIGLLDRSVALNPAPKMSVADEFLEKLFSPDPDSKSLLQSFTSGRNSQEQCRVYTPGSSMWNTGFRQQPAPPQWDGVYMGQGQMCGGGSFMRPDFLHGVVFANPNGGVHGPCFTQYESKPIVVNQRKRMQSGNPMEGSSVKRQRSLEALPKGQNQHITGAEEQRVLNMVERLTGAPFVKPGSAQLGRGGYRSIRRREKVDDNSLAVGGSAIGKCEMENVPPLSLGGDDSGGGQGLQAVLHDVYEIVLGRGVPKRSEQ